MPLSRNLGTLISWNPPGPSGSVTGLLYLYIIKTSHFYITHNIDWARDRSLRHCSSTHRRSKLFFYFQKCLDQLCGTNSLLCSGCREREVDSSPLSIVKIKNKWNYTTSPPHTPSWRAQGKICRYPLLIYPSSFLSISLSFCSFLSIFLSFFLYNIYSFIIFSFATSLYFLFIFLSLSILM